MNTHSKEGKQTRRRWMPKLTAATSALLLVATTTASTAGAQESTTCNGLSATMVTSDLDGSVAGTNGDDVIIVEQAEFVGDGDVDDHANVIGEAGLIIVSLGGDDTICIRGANTGVELRAGSGNDTVIVDAAPEQHSRILVLTGSGDDNVEIIGGFAEVLLGEGNDVLEVTGVSDRYGTGAYAHGGAGNDILTGGAGYDYLYGEDGEDVIRGGAGADYIDGGDGTDMLYGGWGDDEIEAGRGPDIAYGSRGNDIIFGGEGADEIHGGPGDDTLLSSHNWSRNPYITSDVFDTAGARMFGGEGDDILWGSNRWDRMQGGPGDDMLAGFEGRDYMRGGPGNDELIGGANSDDVNGNTGRDRVFIQGEDVASGGHGTDDCGGFAWESISIPQTCETSFSTTFDEVEQERYDQLHEEPHH